ncbi:UNVERIFIED_CONTAM: Pentatricopeptide repeat-containing protein [Sesamum radiatum]|uniref:Pentatricopeptide repeat-containing protein n=1 Tax=Sesamum radiatum TaxID=300843 RepID=A0AAW2RD15_SESRA
MGSSNFASSECQLVRTVCAIVVKGYLEKLLKPKISSLVTSSVMNQALLNLSPYGFSISWSFFKWVETIPHYKHSLQSSWTMICILTKQRHYRAAQDLLQKIARKDFLSSPTVLNALVNSYSDLDVNSHVLSWLVIFYANSKMNPDAIQVFEHMRVCGYKPHLHACTALLNSLERKADGYHVENLYKKMIKVGVLPNLHVYNVLIHACCKSGDVKKAEELLSEMELKNILPDLLHYNTLISLYCKKGMHYEALSVLDRMERGGDANKLLNEMSERKIEPDIVTCNTLINAYCKIGDMMSALKVKSKMLEAGLDLALIHGFCKAQEVKRAKEMLLDMLRAGFSPSYCTYLVVDFYCSRNDDKAILTFLMR